MKTNVLNNINEKQYHTSIQSTKNVTIMEILLNGLDVFGIPILIGIIVWYILNKLEKYKILIDKEILEYKTANDAIVSEMSNTIEYLQVIDRRQKEYLISCFKSGFKNPPTSFLTDYEIELRKRIHNEHLLKILDISVDKEKK